jgi:hypothetical protein
MQELEIMEGKASGSLFPARCSWPQDPPGGSPRGRAPPTRPIMDALSKGPGSEGV